MSRYIPTQRCPTQRCPTQRRAMLTLLLVLLAGLAAFGLLDRALAPVTSPELQGAAGHYLDQVLERATVTFAIARSLNGVISVIQTGTITLGVGASPGEILDPLNDLIEQLSLVMLASMVATEIQKLVLALGDRYALPLGLGVGSLLLALRLWLPGVLGRPLLRVGGLLVGVAVTAKILLPLALLGADSVADQFLAERYAQAEASLHGVEAASTLNQQAVAPDQGVFDRFVGQLGGAFGQGSLVNLKEQATRIASAVITMITVFLVQTVVLPTLFLWLLVRMVMALFGRSLSGTS